jgi:hypothetical protein
MTARSNLRASGVFAQSSHFRLVSTERKCCGEFVEMGAFSMLGRSSLRGTATVGGFTDAYTVHKPASTWSRYATDAKAWRR